MVQNYNIEVVFHKGEHVEPLGDPFGPTRREMIEMSSERSKVAAANGTAHWEQLNADLEKRLATGRVSCEEVARPALKATVQPIEI